MLSFVNSTRGKPKLVYNGYNYHLDKKTDTSCYWKCDKMDSLKCKSRVVTIFDLNGIHVCKKG